MTLNRPQSIIDRIACWKTAYDAVLAEVGTYLVTRTPNSDGTQVVTLKEPAHTFEQVELAARTAATLAIGATTRERGE